MTQQNSIVRVEALQKTYQDEGVAVHALRGVDLTVAPGEFTAVVGPSGSGKTTLLNIVSGLDSASSGEVWLNDRRLSEMSGRELSDFRRDHVGFIFQAYNLIPVLTARENIEYVMLLQGVPKEERRQRVGKLLETIGMSGLADRQPPQLSGGQQQRVAIARAMVSRPSLILADEPTANLDSDTGADLLKMMRSLNEDSGVTFLFSTHDQLVMQYARRKVTVRDGQVVEDKTRNTAG